MSLTEISSEEYNQLLDTARLHTTDLVSYDNNYELLLDYAGEYRMGDTWYWGKIINTKNNDIVWEHNKGYPIRSISEYPWSFDSKACYFSLINQGNQIVMVDIESKKLKRIFKCRSYENRANWIIEVLKNLNGIMFYSKNFSTGQKGQIIIEFYYFTNNIDSPVLINTFIEDEIIGISESNKKNHLIVITNTSVFEFDIISKDYNCIHVIRNKVVKRQNILYTKYLPTSEQIIFNFLDSDWKYFKFQLNQETLN